MRKILVSLFLFSLMSNYGFSQDSVKKYFDKDWKEVSNKNEAYYYRLVFADSIDGLIIKDFYMNNKIAMTGKLRAEKFLNVRQGHFVYYYENGKIKSDGFIINNRKEGIWKYFHENGQKQSEGNTSWDRHEGIWNYWYENGQIMATGIYKFDKPQNVWEYWHEGGGKKSIGKYIDGVMYGEWIYWDNDGQIASKGMYNKAGLKNGEWLRRFGNEELKINYKNGIIKNKIGGIIKNE